MGMKIFNSDRLKRYIYRMYCLFPFNRLIGSKESIDVVIPCIEKDLQILPLCLQGIRKNIDNPVKDIYIVAPDTEMIRRFCSENDLVYVDEIIVL